MVTVSYINYWNNNNNIQDRWFTTVLVIDQP